MAISMSLRSKSTLCAEEERERAVRRRRPRPRGASHFAYLSLLILKSLQPNALTLRARMRMPVDSPTLISGMMSGSSDGTWNSGIPVSKAEDVVRDGTPPVYGEHLVQRNPTIARTVDTPCAGDSQCFPHG